MLASSTALNRREAGEALVTRELPSLGARRTKMPGDEEAPLTGDRGIRGGRQYSSLPVSTDKASFSTLINLLTFL